MIPLLLSLALMLPGRAECQVVQAVGKATTAAAFSSLAPSREALARSIQRNGLGAFPYVASLQAADLGDRAAYSRTVAAIAVEIHAQALQPAAGLGDIAAAEAVLGDIEAEALAFMDADGVAAVEGLRAAVGQAKQRKLAAGVERTAAALADREVVSDVSGILKAETAPLHAAAQKHPWEKGMVQLLKGREVRLRQYKLWLAQNLLLHRALEKPLVELRSTPALALVVKDERLQAPKLLADLAHLGVDPEMIQPTPAVAEFEAVVARAAADAAYGPYLLLGMHYVLEGRKNGSHYISIVLRRLMDVDAYRYMDPYGGEQGRQWAAYKAELNSVPLTRAQADQAVLGARAVYRAVLGVNDGLIAQDAAAAASPVPAASASRWLKRGGLALFLFFLLKGLFWLALGWAAVHFGLR